MLKNQKGITLIALVVTIVVLLILAAITITLAVNNNGIYERALEAQRATLNAQAYDKEVINETAAELDNLISNIQTVQGNYKEPTPLG